MKIDLINPKELNPSEYNPRLKLTAEDKEQLRASLDRFGFVEPIVVNSNPNRKNIIIGGHQRFYIALEDEHDTVPVHYVNIPDLDKEKELNLRLNRNQSKIVVWHYPRGIEEFETMCKNYPIVAIGGSGKTEESRWVGNAQAVRYFISTAKKLGAKIHGLGFTRSQKMNEYKFDQVDSTTWNNGGIYGEVHLFKDGKIERIKKPMNTKIVDSKKQLNHNLNQWFKFQKYAEDNL